MGYIVSILTMGAEHLNLAGIKSIKRLSLETATRLAGGTVTAWTSMGGGRFKDSQTQVPCHVHTSA